MQRAMVVAAPIGSVKVRRTVMVSAGRTGSIGSARTPVAWSSRRPTAP